MLEQYVSDFNEFRNINNKFGEGTSPKIRKIRTGLQTLGLILKNLLNILK